VAQQLGNVPVAGHVVAGQGTGRSRELVSSPRCSIHGKVTKHGPQDPDVTSLRQWLWRVPASVIDAGLAAAVAVAVAIGVSTRPGARSVDVFAYVLGLMIAALVLVRRRWPVAVLVASAAILHVYYLLDYPGILPAVPLAVALAGAWAAGHVRWSLLVAAWFVGGPFLFRTLAEPEPLARVLNDSVADAALFGAVLLLGEAVRTRRALRREHHLLLAEQEKSERLLLNVLPASIAARLKDTDDVIADAFADVTVLFADIVDFTRHSQQIAPEQVVKALNGLFSVFDQLAKQRGLEKIKTIGDAYMVVGGLPDRRPDHAVAVADMALAMRDEVAGRVDPSGRPLAVRIGIDTGPVVAGVIGTSKFSYDLWGDTVNTASRMESHGVAGCIQVTARTYERLKHEYRFERRGPIHVKGKGEMVTYVLIARKQ
jgi:class 3 adenylate cyclase